MQETIAEGWGRTDSVHVTGWQNVEPDTESVDAQKPQEEAGNSNHRHRKGSKYLVDH